MNRLVNSLINFIISFFFIFLGILSILIPWLPGVRADVIRFISENSIAISLFGAAFLVIGTVMVVNIVLNSRRHYYEFRVGASDVSVDEDLIQKYIDLYFEKTFPLNETPSCLVIKDNLLHITVDLPYIPLSQRDAILEKIQADLKDLFSEQLGYITDYYLNASFQPEPKHTPAATS